MTREPSQMHAGLMTGKRGLVMGVANDHSIAWGIAKMLAAHGATLAFTYQGEALGKRVKPLAQSLGSSLVLPCDVENLASVDSVFAALGEQWGSLDFLVHAIAFSDKNELKGRYADTTRENFARTMVISCFSFTEIAKRAAALMPHGGAMVTLTFGGSTARDAELQRHGRRQGGAGGVGALSRRRFRAAGDPRQRDFGRAGPHARRRRHRRCAADVRFPAAPFAAAPRRQLEEIGGAALYLLSDLSTGVTGDIHFVDSGYNIISMPHPSALKTVDEAEAEAEARAAKDAAQ